MANDDTMAWFDRWRKRPGDPEYADADARLHDEAFSGRFAPLHRVGAPFFRS